MLLNYLSKCSPVFTLSPTAYSGSYCVITLWPLDIVIALNFSHFGEYVVAFYCGFNLNPWWIEVEYLFMYLLIICLLINCVFYSCPMSLILSSVLYIFFFLFLHSILDIFYWPAFQFINLVSYVQSAIKSIQILYFLVLEHSFDFFLQILINGWNSASFPPFYSYFPLFY